MTSEADIERILKRKEVKLLNKTVASWYFRVTTYYGRSVDITINEDHGKVLCECHYASVCIAARNTEKCRYVRACREYIKRLKDE